MRIVSRSSSNVRTDSFLSTSYLLTLRQHFEWLHVEEDCYLLSLPREIRNILYEFLVQVWKQARNVICYHRKAGRLHCQHEAQACRVLINFRLTCRLIYIELLEHQVPAMDSEFRPGNLLKGPRRYPPNSISEDVIMRMARRYQLLGDLNGLRYNGCRTFDFSITLSFDTTKKGYTIELQLGSHHSYVDRPLRECELQVVARRVDTAVANMVTDRQRTDSVSGLTKDGLHRVIDAMYLNDKIEHTREWMLERLPEKDYEGSEEHCRPEWAYWDKELFHEGVLV